jgi:hypothetical protein
MPGPPPIPLTGTGGLFTRIGAYGGLLNAINASRGTTIPAHVATIQGQFLSSNQDVIDNIYTNLNQYQNSCSAFNAPIQSMCNNTVIEMANQSLLLANQNPSTALAYLISQMNASNQTVNQCTVGATVNYSPFNVGNYNLVISLYDFNGVLCEYSLSELLTGACTRDSQSSPSLAGVEPFRFQGQKAITNTFSFLYPEGSGASFSLNAVSGMTNGGSGNNNWLMNGSFETWSPTSGGIPTSWHIGTGTAGTTILQSSSIVYDGLFALEFAGNGSEDTALYQQFTVPSQQNDTISSIYPNNIFAFNAFIRTSGSPASGVLRVALTNGSIPLLNNAGNSNSFTVNLNSIGNTFLPISGIFQTPNNMGPNVYLELKLTTPLPSGKNIYIDRVSFAQMIRTYAGGPYATMFSGNVPALQGDLIWLNVGNNYNGQFQWLFQKQFNMVSLGLILPSSVSPTISDSLIA